MDLRDTFSMMFSADYKERFKAEYWQLKIRLEKLRTFLNKIEAAGRCKAANFDRFNNDVPELEMPTHNCPYELLQQQYGAMEEYLHLLELRAVIEGVDLSETHQGETVTMVDGLFTHKYLKNKVDAAHNMMSPLHEALKEM